MSHLHYIVGTLIMWPTNTPPHSFLICNGAAVSRTTYSELFALIGTTFGAGDGSTTFNLPDFRQRFPLGKAASGTGSALGETGGAIDHTHDVVVPSEDATVLLNLGQVAQNGTYTSTPNNPPFLSINFIIKY